MPICEICDKRGHGVQFPMTPKTDGYKFGTICGDCDDRLSSENPHLQGDPREW